MTLDEFLGFFPKEIQETPSDKAGLILRFSVTRNKWLVGYGMQRAKRYEHHKNQVGLGDSVKEALDDLVEKIKKYNFSDKYETRTRVDKVTSKNSRKGIL